MRPTKAQKNARKAEKNKTLLHLASKGNKKAKQAIAKNASQR